MDSKLKRKALAAVCAGALGAVAATTHAAPITQWSYATNATFTDPRWFSGDIGSRSASDYELKWGGSTSYENAVQSGTPGQFFLQNQSALTIGDFSLNPETFLGGGPATGFVNTIDVGDSLLSPGVVGRGVSFTHWNNPIAPNWSSLDGATIVDTITLTPEPANGQPSQDGPTFSFVYNFRETPNDGDSDGLCEDGNSAASVYNWNSTAQTGGCPDIFAFESFGITNQLFEYDGFDYLLSVLTLNPDGTVNALGIPDLSPSQCSAAGFAGECSGFTTLEGQRTTVRFGFAISAIPLQDVPAPGVLALLGIGLAGLAGGSRRRSRAG
jgi:hypothetical protein